MPELRLVRVQAKKTPSGEVVLYIHLPREFVERVRLSRGDYLVWEIDGKNRLLLRKLRFK